MLARTCPLWLALLLYPAAVFAQSPPTLRVPTRLVYVDVVVRDHSGHVVHGLTQQDFRLEEDNKPQAIDFFSSHTYDLAAPSPPHPASPIAQPGGPSVAFSNHPSNSEPATALNIILFDLANTPAIDQLRAHQQLVQFLRTLPPGQQVALFALTSKLTMIQPFTGSSDRLIEAARQIDPADAGSILSKASQMQADDFAAEATRQLGRSPAGGSAIDHQQTLNSAADDGSRARITAAAFDALARLLGPYPGRKNLLWLAEAFPISLGAQLDEERNSPIAYDSRTHSSASRVPLALEAAAHMASAQIAVYPISLLGLETEGIDASSSGVAHVSPGGGANGDAIVSQFNARHALKSSMNDIADQTGGEAFAGTNDFAQALRRGLGDGSNYYTLAYQPHNPNWDGRFRKIHVDLLKHGYVLSYRRGYFALADTEAPPSQLSPGQTGTSESRKALADLNAAFQPLMPEAPAIPLNSTVDLPAGDSGIVRVHSAINPRDLALDSTPDGHRHGRLLVLLGAFSESASTHADAPAQIAPVQTSALLNLDLDPTQYQAALTKGLAFTQQLKLPPGRYRLRLGVSDLVAHHLGSLDMQAQIGKIN